MAAKTPTLGSFFGMSAKVRKDPNTLVDSALDMFKEAQVKMAEAEQQLNTQIADDQAEIEKLERQKAEAGEALVRAQRVRQRFEDLLA